MGATRGGVWYDLAESPISYEWRGLTYRFSSESHRSKFVREVRKRELWLRDSLSRRFRCTVELDVMADIQLYSQVETRGFLVVTNDGAEYKRPTDLVIVPDMSVIGVVGMQAMLDREGMLG